ncbi:MAG: hypothetical protein J1F35_04050 [Erysipelotrichales bacterium]|nr:hypothetical protein [Erysipelotrichales bacterium]
MQKSKKMLLIILAIILVIYIVFKGFLFFVYDLTKVQENTNVYNFIKSFNPEERITVKKTDLGKDYFTYDCLKIKDEFELYEENINSNFKVYILKDTNDKVVFNKIPSNETLNLILDMSKDNVLAYDLTKEFENNKINTTYKAYEYLISNANDDINIFSSINKIRKIQTINFIANSTFGNLTKLTLIDGDYDGYIWETYGVKEIFINDGEYSYTITIFSLDYSDEQIAHLISTIEFE